MCSIWRASHMLFHIQSYLHQIPVSYIPANSHEHAWKNTGYKNSTKCPHGLVNRIMTAATHRSCYNVWERSRKNSPGAGRAAWSSSRLLDFWWKGLGWRKRLKTKPWLMQKARMCWPLRGLSSRFIGEYHVLGCVADACLSERSIEVLNGFEGNLLL